MEDLETSSDCWASAVAAKDLEKLHEISNRWLAMELTPAEFFRVKYLGTRTGVSLISALGDAQLEMKLNKV